MKSQREILRSKPSWACCPADILFLIFKKLDIKSLKNCMFVNRAWQEVAEYYCRHYNLWQDITDQSVSHRSLEFSEKSILDWRNLFFNAQQWNRVRESTMTLLHQYNFPLVRNIFVNKENILIVTDTLVNYFNVDDAKLWKSVKTSCLKYEETHAIVSKLTLSSPIVTGYNVLVIINKLHNSVCKCFEEKEITFFDISFVKVRSDYCYIFDVKNVLWRYKASHCEWYITALAKYYGNRNSICDIHMFQDEIYVLLKRGDILRVDSDCKKFEKLFHLEVPMYYLDGKTLMFHRFSVLCDVPNMKKIRLHQHSTEKQAVVACSGVTCALEHGHVLLLGYQDGKIEIYITDHILENTVTPELQFYLQSYVNTKGEFVIKSIDVYEARDQTHHLFVATESSVYQLLLTSDCMTIN